MIRYVRFGDGIGRKDRGERRKEKDQILVLPGGSFCHNASMSLKQELKTFGDILRLLKGINIPPAYLLIPITLGIAAAAFEGASIGLLIPLLTGFLEQDFSFIKEAPYLGPMIMRLPEDVLTSDKKLFAVLISGTVLAVLLKIALKYSSVISMGYFGCRALHHMRKVLFGRYLRFGKLYFDRTNIGHHSMVLSHFIERSLSPISNITKYMNALFSIVVYIVVMSMISWQLTFVVMPLFFVLHLAIKPLVARIRRLSLIIADRGSDLGKKSVEILSVIPLVKSYKTEQHERRQYTDISNEKATLDFRVRVLQELMLPMQEVITLLMAAVLICVMLWLLIHDRHLAATSLLIYFYLVQNASSKFGTLMGFRGTLAGAFGAIEVVKDILSDDGKCYVHGGGEEFAGLTDQIAFKGLTFSYGEQEVLHDVSFTIPKGTMTAIVGPTGSGKTTLINILMRFYDCPSDSVFVDGKDIRNFTIPSLLEYTALVSQDTYLLNDSLRNNITYGLEEVSDAEIEKAVEQARLSELVNKLPEGLGTLVGDRGVKLSGGEKQRVSIARALLRKSEILMLDEATSSLDSQTEKLVQEAIDEAVQGRTSIVIAHRLSTIQNADSIIVIEDGRCTEQGTLHELLELDGTFKRLWEEQKFEE